SLVAWESTYFWRLSAPGYPIAKSAMGKHPRPHTTAAWEWGSVPMQWGKPPMYVNALPIPCIACERWAFPIHWGNDLSLTLKTHFCLLSLYGKFSIPIASRYMGNRRIMSHQLYELDLSQMANTLEDLTKQVTVLEALIEIEAKQLSNS